jgi:cysteine desulfurase
VGFGKAAELSRKEMEADADRLRALAERLHDGIARGVAGVRLNGPSAERLPGNLNLCFDGVSGEDLMMRMPTVFVATGSACSYASQRPSHVLLAIGRSYEQAGSALRFGVGRFTTENEVEEAVRMVVGAVQAARQDREASAPSCA